MKTAEEYLSTVRGWVDCEPEPVLKKYEHITVLRDDLLPAGSKSRFLDRLIGGTISVKEWVYGSSPRVGYGQVSLAYVSSKWKKKSTMFLAEANELHPNSLKAKKFGAKIIQVPMGFMTVCEARAREYVAKDPLRKLVPFGLADDTVYGSIIKVARSLDFVPDEVWTVAGSGVLNRGLQLAWPKAKCFMVSVGHTLSKEEIGRAKMIKHPLKFAQKCKPDNRPPFPSVLEYDSKAWQYVLENSNKRKKVLFWNVAG